MIKKIVGACVAYLATIHAASYVNWVGSKGFVDWDFYTHATPEEWAELHSNYAAVLPGPFIVGFVIVLIVRR